MNEKLMKYLDGVFAPHKDLYAVKELKEELSVDLQEKLKDLKNQGYDDETAYRMAIDSIGDIEEIIESLTGKTIGLPQKVKRDFSMNNLKDSDLKGIILHDGKFNYNDLKKSDFSGSDLTDSSFKCSDLNSVKFDGANLTGVKFIMCNMKNTSFKNCVLENTNFSSSNLSGLCFDNQILDNTIFNKSSLQETSFKNAVFRNVSLKHADVKNANFDGAIMDKLTYAVLKGSKANLTNVTVI